MTMANRVSQLDSARRIGPKIILTDFLIVVKSGITSGEELQVKFEAFLLVLQQSKALWTKKHHSYIQVSKRFKNHLDESFHCACEVMYRGEDVGHNFWL